MKKRAITSRLKTITSLVVGIVIIIFAMYLHLSKLQSDLIESTAMRTAELYTAALKKTRSVYSKHVVAKAKKYGMKVSHDFIDKNDTIPLPATMTILLGKNIGKELVGAEAQLYSPYPFPWKKGTEHVDAKFDNDAWDFLSKNPNSVYYKIIKENNIKMLRYASANIMKESCVTCHNSHPDSPKKDWKLGDVRGILEVNIPLDKIIYQTNKDIKKTMIYYIAIGLIITMLIAYIIYKLYKQADELEDTVEKRTNELASTNDKLEHIFDITPNITILTDGKKIMKANNKFYAFTGYATLDEFFENYNCICDMFITLKGYLVPIIDGETWTEYIISHPNYTHKAIIEKGEVENQFIVNATTYEEDAHTYFIVVFENVTQLQKAAYTDQLTSLANRLKIDEAFEQCAQSNQRYKTTFSIILLDVDHFKKVNDTYGHLVGDDILKDISNILIKLTRKIDLVGRWGGEEFIVISKATDIEGAATLAEKIRISVENHKFTIPSKQSISLGVAQYYNGETIDTLLKRADDALYRAKRNGRNKTEISSVKT